MSVGRHRVEAVEAAATRRRDAKAAGRSYEEQLAFEQANGLVPTTRAQAVASWHPAVRRCGCCRGGAWPWSRRRTGGGRAQARVRAAAARRGQPPAAAPGPRTRRTTPISDVIIAGLVGGGSGGLTPLVFAAREGDIESAKVLIDAGADVNQVTEYGWTPLLVATNNRNYKLGALSARARREPEHRQQRRLDAALPRDRQPQHRRRRLSGAETGHGPSGVHQAAAGPWRRRQSRGSRKTR